MEWRQGFALKVGHWVRANSPTSGRDSMLECERREDLGRNVPFAREAPQSTSPDNDFRVAQSGGAQSGGSANAARTSGATASDNAGPAHRQLTIGASLPAPTTALADASILDRVELVEGQSRPKLTIVSVGIEGSCRREHQAEDHDDESEDENRDEDEVSGPRDFICNRHVPKLAECSGGN